MSLYHYTIPWVVLDDTTGALVTNRSDGILLTKDGVQATAYTILGTPTTIKTGPAGTTLEFTAEIPAGRVKFGDVESAVWADEQHDAAERAEAALAEAQAIRDQVTRIADTTTEVSYIYRDPNGDLRVSPTPLSIAQGGAQVRVTADGDVIATFPS